MIDLCYKIMSQDEQGKKFLKLIDDQNNLQWKILENLTILIKENWNSQELKNELESLVDKHTTITKELNSLDKGNSIL